MGKIGWLRNLFRVIITGIGLGIISAIISAPVIIFVFQGATGNGAALVTSIFVKMGNQIVNAIFLSGFSIEPLDKTIQVLLAFFILKGIPKSLLEHFKTGTLKRNRFIE
jgi:hypothetical protein